MRKEFRAIVSGRVQLVMYRDFARRAARRLEIIGSIRNLPDGSVEVFAQGEEAALQKYLQRLNRGSLLARVENIDTVWQEPTQARNDFRILH